MPATYEPIATTTLGSAANSFTFSSIPSTYTDLKLIVVARVNVTNSTGLFVRFNSDTASNYSQTTLYGTGTGTGSSRFTNSSNGIFINGDSLSTTHPAGMYMDIFSYAGSTNKTSLVFSPIDKNGSGVVEVDVGLWRNTAAINSINVRMFSGDLAAGTTATLYGILKA
jgi:hypothetical protein